MDGGSGIEIISAGSKTLAMLFLVLGLMIAVLYGMKRISIRRNIKKGEIPIKILSTFHFSPKERIEVLDVAGERLVLGIGQGHISFLTRLVEKTEAKREYHEQE